MSYSPIIFYVIISCISLYLHYSFIHAITYGTIAHFVFIIVWSCLLFLLCKIQWIHIAWVFVILPFYFGYLILSSLLQRSIKDPSVLLQFGTPNPKPTTPITTTPITTK